MKRNDMNSTRYLQKLIYAFLLIFCCLLICGIILTAVSVSAEPITPTTLNISLNEKQLVFHASTGVPGLIFVALGVIGLLALLIKIPVTETIHVMNGGDMTGRGSNFMRAECRHVTRNLPVLLYWILKKRMNLSISK